MFRTNFKPRKRPALIDDPNVIQAAISGGHMCVVDQFGVQSFGLNDAGWPRNTISMLERCQTMEQYKLLASRLVETKVQTDKNQKLSLKDRFQLIRPRYAQTACEQEALAMTLAEYDMNAINTKVAKVADQIDASASAAAARAAAASAAGSAGK